MINQIKQEKILKHVSTVTFSNKPPHRLVSNALNQGFPALTTAAGGNTDLEKLEDNPLRETIPLCAEFPTPELPVKLKDCKGDFLAQFFFF